MEFATFKKNKSIVLLAGTFLYSLYSTIIFLRVDLKDIEVITLFAPIALIPLFVIFLLKYSDAEKNYNDDLAMLASFMSTSSATVLALVSKEYKPEFSFYIVLILLANTEVNFIRSKKVACLQVLFCTLVTLVYFYFLPNAVELRLPLIGAVGLVGIWKLVNVMFFRDYAMKFAEDLKNHTYRSTLATISHELNNTSMVLLNYTNRFKEDQNPEVFDKIEHSLNRMMRQVQDLEGVESIKFENYVSNKSQMIKLRN
ncbi:MAG: hypothetical protein CME65_14705 [Halobacteriovoraceae bacterium]|nr:hypothetical protein [Halobacteriovoraceae bacterium]|tara:strand:+ start:1304 stop:2071 length:768 start_codon:yes stop_codon:yes gene_type:complete